MRRLDLYLTRKARAAWAGSRVEDREKVFVLARPGEPDLVLSGPPTPLDRRFSDAREALALLVRDARGAKP